jgi:uncharacterized phage protein (TIGR02218 family)
MAGGATTVARAFAVARTDGVVLGFTDHDAPLEFEGIVFEPESGMTAKALSQTTGLAVDNSEVVGALTSERIREEDILAGRYDGAAVRIWFVNWTDVAQRVLRFRGNLGEIARTQGAFTAELRGLADRLSQPGGRAYHARCSAVLGDTDCGVSLSQPAYRAEVALASVDEGRILRLAGLGGYAERWFEKGRLTVLSGDAAGLVAVVKNDRFVEAGFRTVELWLAMAQAPRAGDLVRIEAGCDKRFETCQTKFTNVLNFRGFPSIPGDDWLMSYPVRGGVNDGGSLRG